MITYPLNNIDYTAEDAELFHCTRTSGIWAEDSFSISVTGADNNVTIGTGIAWINNEEFSGKVTALKTAKILDLGIADGVYPRIDVIAIQFNVNNNATDIIIKKGTPASNPVQPAIVRSGAVYELYLASVYRPTGATTITASNITDLRMDETVCGLMADSVTSIDNSAINAQVEALIANLEAEIEGVRDTSGLMFESEWVEGDVIPIGKGGTSASTAEEARRNLGFPDPVIFSETSTDFEDTDDLFAWIDDNFPTWHYKAIYIEAWNMVFFRLFVQPDVNFESGTTFELGSIRQEELRPVRAVPLATYASGANAISANVTANGTIGIRFHGDKGAGTSLYFSGFWFTE